jgi:hypothetical protein
MRISPQTKNRGTSTAALCLAALLLAGAPAGAETAARVTGLSGSASAGDAPVGLSGSVADGTSIQTAEDGNAAMLVDQRSLVEMCSRTNMKLTRHADTGNRVIEVGAGTTRIIVEPGSDEDHIQIHTPAAIATILGTVVYVTVDPATGESTITSEDNEVKIESADPNVTGSTTISGSEQVTMRPGDAPAAPKRLTRTALSNLAGCLANFHSLDLTLDRAAWSANIATNMATTDADVSNLPGVGSGPPAAATDPPGTGNEDLTDPADTITPIDTVDFPDDMPDLPPVEPPCTIPGGCELPDLPPVEPPCTIPGGCGESAPLVQAPVVESPVVEAPRTGGVSGSNNVLVFSGPSNVISGSSGGVSGSGLSLTENPSSKLVSGGSVGVGGSNNVITGGAVNVISGSEVNIIGGAVITAERSDPLPAHSFTVEP